MNPEFEQSCALLRRAVNEDVISITPRSVSKWRGWKSDLLADLMDNMREEYRSLTEPSPWLGKQSSWQLPQTRRYEQSRHPVGAPITHPDPALDWMVELSRWPVPFGSVGILKSFEQYVAQGETVVSASQNWGDPYFLGTNIRWTFRLSQIHLIGNAWINATGGSAIADYLPGIPYTDFPYTDDLWFPAGSSASANIHFPVPGGFFLRVICLVDAPGTAVTLAGKLAGTVQTELSADAQFTLRTSW